MDPLNDDVASALEFVQASSLSHWNRLDDFRAATNARPKDPLELQSRGTGALVAIEELIARHGQESSGSPGPRYWGFVNGGVTPAALAGDWLASAIDQNGQLNGDGEAQSGASCRWHQEQLRRKALRAARNPITTGHAVRYPDRQTHSIRINSTDGRSKQCDALITPDEPEPSASDKIPELSSTDPLNRRSIRELERDGACAGALLIRQLVHEEAPAVFVPHHITADQLWHQMLPQEPMPCVASDLKMQEAPDGSEFPSFPPGLDPCAGSRLFDGIAAASAAAPRGPIESTKKCSLNGMNLSADDIAGAVRDHYGCARQRVAGASGGCR